MMLNHIYVLIKISGHNGVRSCISSFPSPDFLRMRIGIGRPIEASASITDWVLGKIPQSDMIIYENKVFPKISKWLNEEIEFRKSLLTP
jgi:peptidyl-tRNA hydrolase